MAKWIYINQPKGNVGSLSSLKSFSGQFTGFPLYSGSRYTLTPEKPASTISFRWGSAQDEHWGPVSVNEWGSIITSNGTLFDYTFLDNYPAISKTHKEMILPNKLLRAENDDSGLEQYATVYTDVQISGRCQIDELGTFPNGALIPVHFTINGVAYEGIGNYTSFGTGYSFIKNTNGLTPKAIRRDGENTNTLILDTINVGDILDFGDIPQNVPSILKTWIEDTNSHLKVRDLKNTTWYVPSGWEAKAGYGQFDITGTFQPSSWSVPINIKNVEIGYISSGAVADRIRFIRPDTTNDYVFLKADGEFILVITSGTDTTNPKLIAWISEYGELQTQTLTITNNNKNDETENYTIPIDWTFEQFVGSEFDTYNKFKLVNNGSFTCVYYIEKLVEDSNDVLRFAKDKASGLLYYEGDRDYEKNQSLGPAIFCDGKIIDIIKAGKTTVLHTKGFALKSDIVIFAHRYDALITFTIDGTTYYAVGGMTWEDWVADASLNPDGFVLGGASNYVQSYKADYYVYDESDACFPLFTATIVPNKAYITKYFKISGGGGSN